jgi:hypothetical protein
MEKKFDSKKEIIDIIEWLILFLVVMWFRII